MKELFESSESVYSIAKGSGVPLNTARRLKIGEAVLENATYKNIKLLHDYQIKKERLLMDQMKTACEEFNNFMGEKAIVYANLENGDTWTTTHGMDHESESVVMLLSRADVDKVAAGRLKKLLEIKKKAYETGNYDKLELEDNMFFSGQW